MRKHFLLLFLMALLPLAGWAQTNLSTVEVSVTLNRTQLDYTGNATAPVITAITVDGNDKLADLDAGELIVTYYDEDDNVVAPANLRNAGNYYLTLKGDGDPYTADESDAVNFTINKGTLDITLSSEGTSKVYGAADPTALEYTWDNPSQLKGTDDVNNVILTFTGLDEFTNEDVGTYTFTNVTVTTPNYTVNVSGTPKLIINPAPLTVTYDANANFVISYGEANPAIDETKIAFAGWVNGDDADNNDVDGTLTYTQDETDANYDTAGNAALAGKALYDCEFSGLTSTNYTFTYPTNKMMIKQKALAATPNVIPANDYFTYVKGASSFTYSGEDQTPEYTITYKDAQGNSHVLDANQVALTYTYSATEGGAYNDAADNTKAGYYKMTVTATATGNYSGSVETVAGCNYSIAKKALWVYVANDEKVYDGNGFDLTALANDDFEYNGLVDADNTDAFIATITNISAKWYNSATEADADETPANVSTAGYAIKPVIAAGSNLNNNYTPNALSTGKFKITARPLTATAKDKGITYGDAEPAWASTTTFIDLEAEDAVNNTGLIAADEADVLAALQVALEDGTDYTGVGTYTDKIILTDLGTATNYAITCEPGTYTVAGASFTMIAQNQTITYGDETPEFTYLTSGDEPQAEVAYEFYVDGDWTTTAPTAAGTYEIRIAANDSYLPANYSLPITYVPGTFKIKQKALTITPQTVTLNIGATEEDLNTYGTVAYTGLVGDDEIDFTLKFNTTVGGADEKVETAGDPAALSSAIGEYTQGVTIEVPATSAGYDNANYTINAVAQYGQITVIAANALILAQNDVNIDTKIAAAAAAGTAFDVVFGSKTMVANEWYPMVLPFATSAKELVKQLDQYVVLNTYSTTSTEGDIVFKLEMGDIAAGVPFLIKSGEALDWNNKTFSSKTIVAAPAAQGTLDDNGSIFTGVFSTGNVLLNGYELDGVTEDATLAYRWLSNSTDTEGWGTVGNYWRGATADDHHKRNLSALEAYLQIKVGTNARITVEDFDGQTTSIKTLSAGDMKAVVADGWYTLDGIKLQSAPTQKGIYINNGKKVVLK